MQNNTDKNMGCIPVTRTPRNTEGTDMKLIYNNFDGLDVAFQCTLSPTLLDTIRKAREQAQIERKEIYITLGDKRVAVAGSGAKGGYAFRFDTGMDGETWMVADNCKPEDWNVRVSAKSLSLALYGYQGVKKRILAFLMDELQVYYAESMNLETGEILPHPKASISRLDYCFDFLSESFEPESAHFITSSNQMKKAYHKECFERGDRIESIRIGAIKGRQVAIYDKTREIIQHHKAYWWKLWGLKKEETTGKVWRVEARAGKKELRKWNIRSFEDFESKAGDAIISILQAVRYTTPNMNDSNRSRWPMAPFWEDTITTAKIGLGSFISHAIRKEIIIDTQKAVTERFEKQITGSITSYAAVSGKALDEMDDVLTSVTQNAQSAIEEMPNHYAKKHQHAEDKYQLIAEKPESRRNIRQKAKSG